MEKFIIETGPSNPENVIESEKPKYVFSAQEVTEAIDLCDQEKRLSSFATLTEAIKEEAQNEDLYRIFKLYGGEAKHSPNAQRDLQELINYGIERCKPLQPIAEELFAQQKREILSQLKDLISGLKLTKNSEAELSSALHQRIKDLGEKIILDPISASMYIFDGGSEHNTLSASYEINTNTIVVPTAGNNIRSENDLQNFFNSPENKFIATHEYLHGLSAISMWINKRSDEVYNGARVGLSTARLSGDHWRLDYINEGLTEIIAYRLIYDELPKNTKEIPIYPDEAGAVLKLLKKVPLETLIEAYFIHDKLRALNETVKQEFGMTLREFNDESEKKSQDDNK